MATEVNRTHYIDPSGTPLFIIEKSHGDREGNTVSTWEVRHGGRTIRNELTSLKAAESLVEGMGGILSQPGDARSLAAEIGGTSVLQAALADKVTEMAGRIDNKRDPLLTPPERGISKSEVVGGELPLLDSQATGVMEVTTGLGGLKSHGVAERFEGAAEEPLAAAAIEAMNESGSQDTTKRRERSRSNEGQERATGGSASRSAADSDEGK